MFLTTNVYNIVLITFTNNINNLLLYVAIIIHNLLLELVTNVLNITINMATTFQLMQYGNEIVLNLVAKNMATELLGITIFCFHFVANSSLQQFLMNNNKF